MYFGRILLVISCNFKFLINPFQVNVPFRYPFKTLKNLRYSDVFRGIEMEYWPNIGEANNIIFT